MTSRDPAFWHRFSLAEHQKTEIRSISETTDVEKSGSTTTTTTTPTTPWLSKQQKKRRKYWMCYWMALFVILVFCGAIVGVVAYLKRSHS